MRALPPHVSRALGRVAVTLERSPDLARPAGVRPRGRSRLQQAYAQDLELLLRAGSLLYVREECASVRLAQRTWVRPDFLVQLADGSLEFHEVKGHWEDDARAKLKVAAELHPWARWIAVTGKPGAWRFEVLPGPRRLC